LSLAFVGQAVALQAIDAGPFIRYQHYKPPGRLLAETHPLLLAVLGVQAVLVAGALRRRWPAVRSWAGRTFKAWQLSGVALVFCLTSATVSPQIRMYVWDVLFAAFVQAVNLGTILLMAWALPAGAGAWLGAKVETWLGPPAPGGRSEPRGLDRWALVLAAWVTVLAAVLNVTAYGRHPHLADEVVYLYHARSLAAGMLTLPAPPVPEGFDIFLMELDGDRWYPVVPPGWSAILALGVLLGVPWLVNPLLAGVSVLLTFVLVRDAYDRRTARLAVLLLAISPWHIFLGMSFMNHMSVLASALAAAVALARARRTSHPLWAGLAGLAVGVVSWIRPLDGVVVAGLLGLWALGVGGRRLRASAIAAFALAGAVAGAAVLPYNRLLTGDPATFPIMAYTDKHYGRGSNAIGFGANRGLGWPHDPFPGHGPLDALVNANLNLFSLNIELLGWSIGSLLPLALLLFSGATRGSDHLTLGAVAAVVLAHSFYWYGGGPDFGARYWYLIIVPCVALAARGIRFLARVCEPAADARPRVAAAVLALCALTLVNYVPWRALDKYHHYLGMRPEIRALAATRGFGKSLVLIRGPRHPDYASAAAYNPLDLEADAPVYAWDRSPEVRSRLLQAYRDRPVWIVNGPSVTGRSYQVLEGPRSAEELLARGG
jgi:hypothetical protein